MVRRRHHFRFFLYRIKFCSLFSSSLLRKVFAKADLEGRKFRIIIADGRPKFEGKEMARQLTSLGLHCTYVLVSSVPYIMQEVSFIFIYKDGCKNSKSNLNFRLQKFLSVRMQYWQTDVSCLGLERLKLL